MDQDEHTNTTTPPQPQAQIDSSAASSSSSTAAPAADEVVDAAVDDGIDIDSAPPLCIICRKNHTHLDVDPTTGDDVSLDPTKRIRQALGYLALCSQESVFCYRRPQLHATSRSGTYDSTNLPCSITTCGHAMHLSCYQQFFESELLTKPHNKVYYHSKCFVQLFSNCVA